MFFGKWKLDERFLMHRLYSTRLAAVVTAVVMAIWFEYELLVNGVYHWDTLAFLIVLAVTKVGALIYYRLTN
ncbi:MAG: hypothetical protein H6667_02885 [Ardenticatenaceae bacterium]|nr:hypothetical protein [Ardenticatenaceae bacterium]MCB9442955.1 hypothetical protein [Ardenticatenaceae bacterium]